MSTIIIEPQWCNCDKCWEVFINQLRLENSDKFLLVAKLRHSWRGLPIVVHQERDTGV